MTSYGFDAPIVGPVLIITADALLTTGASVSPTGNAITMSVGTVGVSTSRVVTGNAITLSVSDVYVDRNVTGNLITVSVGGVAVNTGGNANVGVNGIAITIGMSSVSVTADANVTPVTNQLDITLGQAVVEQAVSVSPTGLAVTIGVGTVTISVITAVVPGFDASTANLNGVISDLVVEDDYDLVRSIVGIPAGATLVRAWLTIKSHKKRNNPDSQAIIQKTITTTAVNDVGQITDAGADGTGAVIFQITADETELLEPEELYVYDIQVESDTGKFSTREKGTLLPVQQITQTP